MSRNRLLLVAAGLAVSAGASLFSGISLLHKDIRSYIAAHYQEYSHDVDGKRYLCSGSPAQVASTLAGYQKPAAQATSGGTEYQRYDDAIVSVGADGDRPCSIRVENLSAGYSRGAFLFLGPGFYPGSPSGGSGGSSGGPGGTK